MIPELKRTGAIKSKLNPEYTAQYTHCDDKALGNGAIGSAWKVKKNSTGEIFVGKEFIGDDDECKNSFEPEVAVLPLLKHPNIVETYEVFGKGESGSVIIMEYLDGKDL